MVQHSIVKIVRKVPPQCFINRNIAYQNTPTHPDTHTGPCLDKLELSMVWVREGRGELATGVCSAYSLNASDRLCLKNDTVLKQWKSRAAGTMCCFNCRVRGKEGKESYEEQKVPLFCIDRWMLPLAIHLALMKQRDKFGREVAMEFSPFASIESVPESVCLFSSHCLSLRNRIFRYTMHQDQRRT